MRESLVIEFLRWYDEVFPIPHSLFDPSAWMTGPIVEVLAPGSSGPRFGDVGMVTVGASVPSRRVPNPSYVVGGLGWVSPAAGLRMEVKR